jgi:2,5-dioxopentanoate dehydrogenase
MQVQNVMVQAAAVFPTYRSTTPIQRAEFLERIGAEIEALGPDLIQTAMRESNLPEARLLGERGRTVNQLKLFANLLREGSWVEAVIDSAQPERTPPRPDLRKMLVPLGPVVVFGASNFPFAFSTAGGDTASALAAGCPVVIKGHPGHPDTSAMVFGAMQKAALASNLPAQVVQHLAGSDFALGQALVEHPETKGVAFTGSLHGGMALVEYARNRKVPIPVFAEMGSLNPVVLMPEKLEQEAESLAKQLAASATLGMGQFCTKPGIVLGIASEAMDHFIRTWAGEVPGIGVAPMLHAGIHKNYSAGLEKALAQPGLGLLGQTQGEVTGIQPKAALALADAETFMQNPTLHEEVFGPYALIIKCKDAAELDQVLQTLEGQLTLTLMATEADLQKNTALVQSASEIAGRVVVNGVPTGVEVVASMTHGGPFPATTDSRFTSVGSDAIKRWGRPVSYQNFPQSMLPEALQDGNPLGIWRTVDGVFSKE